jgi:hypothetical protein
MTEIIDTRITLMAFFKDEKKFSLSKTLGYVPYGDITQLFSEFYCYLLVAGLYREGESTKGIRSTVDSLFEKGFYIPNGNYRLGLSTMISKGLKERFDALWNHRDVNSDEKALLMQLAYLFTEDRNNFAQLTARDIVNVAHRRSFSDDMVTIARYVAVGFGQRHDVADEAKAVRKLYISVFGDIHLSKDETLTLTAPRIIYKQAAHTTALWPILSAQIDDLVSSQSYYPGHALCIRLQDFAFLTDTPDFNKEIALPTYANILYLQVLLGIEGNNPVSLSAMFYRDFLYKTNDTVTIGRKDLLDAIIDLMMEKMKETHLSHLFAPDSVYQKITTTTTLRGNAPKRPSLLSFALESLDASAEDDSDIAGDDLPADPLPDDESDTTTLPPAQSSDSVGQDKDTIDLISFDTSGEGVNEDLYRSAVVALNDRLRSDDTLPVSADDKRQLAFWVNGYLYRTAIAETQDLIASLKLQKYVKPFLKTKE